jgi:hypothetical protein
MGWCKAATPARAAQAGMAPNRFTMSVSEM